MVYQIKSNVNLLYSFIHVFIYNSIIKCFWQNFAKPLAKVFRKISNRGFLNAFAKGLAKLFPKTLCDGIMNKDMNIVNVHWILFSKPYKIALN